MLSTLDEKINYLIDKGVFPGCNYCVINNGKKYYGSLGSKAIIPHKEENNIETLYDLASLTKVLVTNTLINNLISNKEISSIEKIKNILPNFKYGDVTIFNLLTHTSGLQADLDWKTLRNREDVLNKIYILEKKHLTNYDLVYSDVGYILLSEIIEKIYNANLDEVAKCEIFDKLEMSNTSYNPKNKELCAPTEKTKMGIIRGIVHDEKAQLMNGVSGHAGVFSNVDDMVNFIQMFLNDGIYNNKQIINSNSIKLLFTPLVEQKNGLKRSYSWIVGKSNATGKYVSDNTINFSGFTGPSILIDRDNNLGIVLLSNRVHPNREPNLLKDNRSTLHEAIYESDELKLNLKK